MTMDLGGQRWPIIAIALLLLALNFITMLFAKPGTLGTALITSLLTVLFALLAVLALLRMRIFLKRLNREWASHRYYIVIGFALWLVAETIWAYFSVSGEPPHATVADVFWLLGYAFMIAGFVKANMETRVIFRPRDTIFALIFAIFALAVAAFVLLPMYPAPFDPVEKLLNLLLYPVSDVIILFLTLRLAMAFFSSPLGFPWAVFLLGFMMVALSDSWYAYLLLTNTYYVGHASDFLYNAGYILTTAGALLFEATSRMGFKPEEAPAPVEKVYAQLEKLLLKKRPEQAASITTAIDSVDVDTALLKLLTKENKMSCVFLCLDRPHTYFLEELQEEGIDAEMVHFVTLGLPGREANQGGLSFINSPEELTAIKMHVDSAAKRMKEKYRKTFVLIDCIPTLLLYNDMKRLGKFLHDLNLSLRDEGAYQVLLLSPNGEINPFILHFCDTNISLV